MTTYPTLASETIVERKGDDALDRRAHAVLTHKNDETTPAAAGGEVATGDHEPAPVAEESEAADEASMADDEITAHNAELDQAEDHSG